MTMQNNSHIVSVILANRKSFAIALAVGATILASLLGVALVLLPLHGSPSLAMTISTNGEGAPTLDFTTEHFFPLEGKSRRINQFRLDELQIWQVDKNGNRVKCVWDLQPSPDGERYVERVNYGEPPPKWIEKQKAERLENESAFLVNNSKLFIRHKNEYEVLSGNFHDASLIGKALREQALKRGSDSAAR